MADYSTPFADNGERRVATSQEKSDGFPCGPADQALFNGLFHQIQAEIGEVVGFAGITPTDSRDTLLREAIEALIAAATGGNPAGYILMSQARARLPIFPEILSTDGSLTMTVPSAGNVRLPGGVNFLHRGIFQETTVQTDWPTDPSKTYHIRWDPTNGFRILDVASPTYNPSALVEGNAFFDSKYDDMLVARIITNASNVATITNLINKNHLVTQATQTLNFAGPPANGNNVNFAFNLNWSRTIIPVITWDFKSFVQQQVGTASQVAIADADERIQSLVSTRYGVTGNMMLDWADGSNNVIRLTAMV